MNILTSNSMLMLQRSMGFLWSKQDCILNNLANAETPGYKTQYVTFEESLRDAVQAAADKPQPGAAMREAIVDTPVQLHEAQESVRMDDNGVDIMEQSVELARNGYQLQYVMSAISGELSLLRTRQCRDRGNQSGVYEFNERGRLGSDCGNAAPGCDL